MRLTVIGTGYLGAVHAACMAEIGHDVLGVDTDASKIKKLAAGSPPFFEPGLGEILDRNVRSGRLRFTTSLREAADFGDVHFICVGTPQRHDSPAADLRHVDAVVTGLTPHLHRRCLIVGKSTVPVGTTVRLASLVDGLAPEGGGAEIAWNPGFLREGFAVQDALRPDRLVAGVLSAQADQTLRAVYAPMLTAGVPYLCTDPATAELVKAAANSFLATKISFINAMAEVCDAAGADVATLADAIGHDTRIGRRCLSAGLGFGGRRLPKDIRAFAARARELGVGNAVEFLREIDSINLRQRRRTLDIARELVGGDLSGRRVAILGVTFKPDSDDVRDSPALAVAEAALLEGAQLRIHDPEGAENARAVLPEPEYAPDAATAVRDADIVLHLTEWAPYRALDPAALAPLVRTPRILDARNALNAPRWRAAGWTVRTLGRPTPGGAAGPAASLLPGQHPAAAVRHPAGDMAGGDAGASADWTAPGDREALRGVPK
ncbi:UDP-glucose/GDP-mannose dehydrogenase family protein [Streptomyces sp. HNM0663]|uniref:UDP-glucose 6-dehydrogenase n=1 Tax=Streptomyces chengmaiensis TaxID=3040919 RepID=A0ABT6HWX9_9ACTN|nr:UDP-glucose/GDP-mannose dehydrogenase family protein [Streptomyces chengmaiensis]MDH2392359.1 UDP-glucose/GDP-mannose dehydrogenase family protein [Streptomyces chengmaiensis]